MGNKLKGSTMADGTTINPLANALGGLRITGAENPYGMGLIALNQAAPSLYNPYGKPAGNFGIALGQALLSGLLGYQAKKQATEESLQASDLATQLLAKPATERTTFLQGLQQQDVPMNVMSKLTELNPMLMQQELAARAEQAAAKRKLEQEIALEYVKQTGNLPAGFESLQPLAAAVAPTATPMGTPALAAIPGMTPKRQREIQQEFDKEEIVKGPQRRQEAIDKERQALTKQGENATQISNMYNSIEELMSQDSRAADNELARLGTKIGDPASIVSPNEAKARLNVLPVLEQYKNELSQVLSGKSVLSDPARADLLKAFKVYVDASSASYTSQAELAKSRLIANKQVDATDPQLNTKVLPFELPSKTASEKAIDRLAEISKEVRSADITPQQKQNLITEANNLAAKYGKVWQLTRAPKGQ
jgi:hypothetical protein